MIQNLYLRTLSASPDVSEMALLKLGCVTGLPIARVIEMSELH